MVRSPKLTRRSLVVLLAAALLAVVGGVIVQLGVRDQRRHYEEVGAMAAQRAMASALVRSVLLAGRGEGDVARARHDVAATRRRIAEGRRLLLAPAGAPLPGGVAARALRDGAGPEAAAIAAAQQRLLDVADAVARAPGGALDSTRVGTLLAAEQQLLRVTAERGRVVLAATNAELIELRRGAGAATVLLLVTLAAGGLLVVRPAARELERLVAELLASRTQLEAASAEAVRGREFAASLVASAADAIYAFDAGLAITEWNPAMAAWTGVPRAAALGRRPAAFEAELDWGEGGSPYERALAGHTTSVAELRGRAGPGAPWARRRSCAGSTRGAGCSRPARSCRSPRTPGWSRR